MSSQKVCHKKTSVASEHLQSAGKLELGLGFILFYFFLLLSVAGKKISQLGQGSVRISGCLSKLSSNILVEYPVTVCLCMCEYVSGILLC